MNTKSFSIFVTSFLTAMVSFASCQKTPLQQMSGSYTYKTSGVLGLTKMKHCIFPAKSDTVWYSLSTEQGQMNVVAKDKDNSTAIVTWNDITGDASSTEAGIDGNAMILAPAVKTVTLSNGIITRGRGIVTYSGTGTLYENMLIIPMKYEGYVLIGSDSMAIVSSKVECVAKAN